MITSTQNAKIKHLAELRDKSRTRNKEGLMIAEGFRIFDEAPENLIKEIYVEEGTYAQMQNEGSAPSDYFGRAMAKIEKCRSRGCFFETVSDSVMQKASDTSTPQGIIFVCSQPNFSFEDLVRNIPEVKPGTDNAVAEARPGTDSVVAEAKPAKGNILILEDIQDPGNLGTMMRTAEAAGMSGVIMSKKCADIYNPKTVRSTMGGIFRVPHIYTEDLLGTVNALKKEGFRIYATDLDADGEYDKVDYPGRCGILIGNEGNGLSREMIENSDTRVIIPMCGEIESLNAAVAAALMMYISR